ncbi:MAG: amidohydrolase family protein [Actinomycetota bacterium]|jgi:predicted TIM-barrel fold metal-dependent hydrolase
MTLLDKRAEVLDSLRGRILDMDQHEYAPAHQWTELFGEFTAPFADFLMKEHDPDGMCSFSAPVYKDEGPVEKALLEDAWDSGRPPVGPYAPGAWNMHRRLEVLDYYGYEQAFLFPSGVGMMGYIFINTTPERLALFNFGDATMTVEQMMGIGRGLLDAWNTWCIEQQKISPRLRPVAFIDSNDLDLAVAEVHRLAAAGIRAIGIPSGVTPGGKSPGHPDTDPLWAAFVEHDIPVLFHAGGDYGILRSATWGDYGFNNGVGQKMESPEGVLEPWTWSQMHMGTMNQVSLMILGGVLDRFPQLRVGCIEVSAHWVGPMIENLTNVGSQFRRLMSRLELTPQEYVERNVRVSGFFWEPMDVYLDRFPWLENILVYGSDYGHYEGGRDPVHLFAEKLERFGPEMLEKFFVTNARLLMP